MTGLRLADEADVTTALALANGPQQSQLRNCLEGVDCGVVIAAAVTDACQPKEQDVKAKKQTSARACLGH
jgi:hypothetical protein